MNIMIKMTKLGIILQIDYVDGDTIETVTDYDGNSYNVVRVGTQGWSVGNLKTTKYLDGSSLTGITTAFSNTRTFSPKYTIPSIVAASLMFAVG